MYRPSVHNLGLALHRLFNVRKPELPGHCAMLYWKQGIIAPHFTQHFTQYSQLITDHTAHYTDSFTEEVLHHADVHPKRALRIRAHLEALQQSLHQPGPRLNRERVVVKFKVEVAKAGKVPRTIVDLGCMASLVGAWLASTLKKAMAANPLRAPGLEARFVPDATYRSLKAGFDFLRNAPERYNVILFSDDAAISVRDGNTIRYYDLDISSCDKSHGAAIFNLVRAACPMHLRHELEWLLAQLRATLRIRHPNLATRECFDVRPICETLYSGSVLTTLINNIAVMLIALAIADAQATTVEEMKRAAESVGYIVTLKEHEQFEQVQFLKHSPARDVNGEYQPLLNFGVYARAAGVTWGELPNPSLPLRERAAHQQAALLKCMWPNTHFPALTRARTLYSEPLLANITSVRSQHTHAHEPEGWPELHFDDSAVLGRYGLTDITAIAQFLALPPGYQFNHPDIAHTLQVDYELDTVIDPPHSPTPLAPRLPCIL